MEPSRVLVIDDDLGLLEVVASILEPLGLKVTTTWRVADALQLLSKNQYDLVVSDVVMPGIDGFDLIDVMRGRGDETPIIFLSGSATLPEAVKLMKAGACSFLQKPFEPLALKKEVLEALKTRARAKSMPPPFAGNPAATPPTAMDMSKFAMVEIVEPSAISVVDLELIEDSTLTHSAQVSSPVVAPKAHKLGRYELRGVVASGGMGKVYRAFDPNLEREVALKVLRPPESEDEKAQFLPRFRREAVALAKLRHPHIVSVYDCDIDPSGIPYVVMELVTGESLGVLLRRLEKLPLSRALHIAWQMADALAYAHDHGIVHRDVKPDNVIVGENDWVRLIDFGVARVDDSNLTVGAYVLGSPNYLSPEAATGKTVDARADQFSLATVILEMVSGQRVFRGDAIGVTVRNVCEMEAPTLEQLGITGGSPALQELLTQMHDKDPDKRVRDDHELRQRLTLAWSSLGGS